MTDQETSQDDAAEELESKEERTESSKKSKKHKGILLVPYPKFVFMYPTLIVSAFATVILSFGDFWSVAPAESSLPVVMTSLFLVVMMVNMFVIVFDFPRATSLTLVFIVISVLLGFLILLSALPNFFPPIANIVSTLRPAANATFFACITLGMICMYIAIFISVRFNYWELRKNELLHHHGLLSDLKRYPAPNLRVDKEINDVFEFMLLGAGRLILHPSTEKRAIVLDNILFVSDKERELTKTLGSIKVQIGSDSADL